MELYVELLSHSFCSLDELEAIVSRRAASFGEDERGMLSMPARVSAHEVRRCGLFVVDHWQVHLLSRCLETEPEPRQMLLSPESTRAQT